MSSKYMLQKIIVPPRSSQRLLSKCSTSRALLKSNILGHQSRNYHHSVSSLYPSITESNSNKSNKFDRSNARDIFASFSSTSNDDKENTEKPPTERKAEPIEEEKLEFQAETRQLLDIVTHSLYTDKQVFLRELISNGSDALEKLRHLQSSNDGTILDASVPLEIRIETDEANGTLTITDTGVGMTKEEMISNLGTIARSGSKAFVQQLSEMKQDGQQESAGDAARGIIGKFGVGFYSAFMVGDKVEVRSKYSLVSDEDQAKVWTSSGGNTFSLATLDPSIRQDRGTSIVIHVKDDMLEFVQEARIEEIIKTYSNFVNFPILLNGNRVNTIKAIWSVSPKEVTDEAYTEFYKFVANARDDPVYRLHLRFDAPLDIKALLFVPTNHTEKFGMGRMNPGVSLYSRKVLIENKCPDILPEWLRFLKGVVDSEDLPVSISREKAQDTALIAKIRKALTRRFLNFLTNKAKKEPDDFKNMFYPEYGYFIKEGVCADPDFQDQLSKLLYWETSKTLNKELSSFDEYIARSPPEQKEIYFLCTASRDVAFQSPYYEAFKKAGREVIFLYSAIDEFTLQQLDTYEGRKIVSIENGDIDLGKKKDVDSKTEDGKEKENTKPKDKSMILTENEISEFCTWFQSFFPGKVQTVKSTTRLSNSPAMITNHESGAMRRMMKLVDSQDVNFQAEPLPELNVEFNPEHEIIVRMFRMRKTDPILSKVCAEQVYDNCLVAAGLLDDSRTMLGRLNDILLVVVKGGAEDDGANTSNNVENIEHETFEVKAAEEDKEFVEGEIVEETNNDEQEENNGRNSDESESDSDSDEEDSDSDSDEEDSDNEGELWKEFETEEKKLLNEEKILEDQLEGAEGAEEAEEAEEETTEHKTYHRFQKNKKPKKSNDYNSNDAFMRKKKPELFTEKQKEQQRKENKNFAKKTSKTMDEELGDSELRAKQRKMADAWLTNELGNSDGRSIDKRDIFGFDGDTSKSDIKKTGNKKKRRSRKGKK